MYSIQLDIAADCSSAEIIRDTFKFDIAAKVVSFNGPAGGNPIFEFYGNKEKLIKFCDAYDFYYTDEDLVKV